MSERPQDEAHRTKQSSTSTRNAEAITGKRSRADAIRNEPRKRAADVAQDATVLLDSPPESSPAALKQWAMGGCVYTPLSMLAAGDRANIAGVIVASATARQCKGGDRDTMISISICDASCVDATGSERVLARSLKANCFHPKVSFIPQSVSAGQVIIIREAGVKSYEGRPQVVCSARTGWSWAIFDPITEKYTTSPNYPVSGSDKAPQIYEDEAKYLRKTAEWYRELQGAQKPQFGRREITLDRVESGTFFDCVVEVIKLFTQNEIPDIYVTDYTSNKLLSRTNDDFLELESNPTYLDDGDGYGHTLLVSLWNKNADLVHGLCIGDIVRLKNVRPKLSPHGFLEASLGSADDFDHKITLLLPEGSDVSARNELISRRTQFLTRS